MATIRHFRFFITFLFLCYFTAPAQWTQTQGASGSVLAFAVKGKYLFAAGGDGVFRSVDNGTTWIGFNLGLANGSVYALAVSGSNIFIGAYRYGVLLSTDDGASWRNVGLTTTYVYAVASSGTNIVAGTYDGIFLSTNNGTDWTHLTNQSYGIVTCFAVNGTNLFAGRGFGSGAASGVLRSTDNGANWTDAGLSGYAVHSIFTFAANLFAATDGGVFLSTNNGATWTALGLQDVYAVALSGNRLFAGTYAGGVYLSTDNGSIWRPINAGLTFLFVRALAVVDSNLLAGTFGATGVWKRSLTDQLTSVRDPMTEVINHFSLDQNYPNPFNPNTTITFSLARSDLASLRIYNVLGKEVATLISGSLDAGTHVIHWDANGFSSGTYTYRLQVGNRADSKKLILLK